MRKTKSKGARQRPWEEMMKKLTASVLLVLILALCGLTGCTSFKQDMLNKQDISILDASGKTIVSYGMKQEDVEKTLGQGQMNDEAGMMVYQDGKVNVWYRDKKVAGFICANPEYSSPRGVKAGDTAMAVRNAYGSDTLNRADSTVTEGDKTFTYSYNTNTHRPLVVSVKPSYNEKILKQIVSVSFLLDADGYVKSFSASDYLMGYYLR